MNLFILSLLFKVVLILGVSGTCTYITQADGQYCWDLSVACGIDLNTLYSYNPSLGTDCSGLIAGQKVCCTSGGIAPNQNSDGSCYSYKIQSGDYCNKIAADFGITVDQLLQYNTQTWGWLGCDNIQLDQNICVSTGTPPKPTADPAATCGKTAPGNLYDSACPLNACCSQWGYCGMGEEFCTTTTSATNNPGTTGCQSHCEMGYNANTGPPSEFIKLGYYETWNPSRDCLTMDINQLQLLIDSEKYTHMHYAFGVISDYHPYVEDQTMWQQFLQLKNVKKIISFGGWSFSTEDATRPIFGDAVLTDQFVSNLVNMVQTYGLDGVDIDWEYPGATDLKGWADSTPTVHPNDGENYLNFLRKLRSAMPSQYSVSICAPASYWYLKNFPIAEMNQYLTYIVFMTYDLHGQWDINIESLGPKLLSHVSKPETINALAMITKAGMDSNKVLMGVASYGRAFWQSDPNCSGPTCTFTAQGATPGRCTKESSYLGYGEIEEIIKSGNYRDMYYDSESDSDILLYGTNDWVAYTNISTTMNGRYEMARSMNLGGTVEWAVDLRATNGNKGTLTGTKWTNFGFYNDIFDDDVDISSCPTGITTLDDAANVSDEDCIDYAIAQALSAMLATSLNDYDTIMNPSDGVSDYNYLYSQKYKPYVINLANANHIRFWDKATIESNAINSAFDKYVNCEGDCVNGGSISLKQSIGDITVAIEDYIGSVYIMMNSTFNFPYSYEHDKGQNIIQYNNFPIIDPDNSFPDPSVEVSSNSESIIAINVMLTNALNNFNDYDFEDVVDATMYNVISVCNAIDSMKQIVEIGNKIVEEEEKAALRFFLDIFMMLVEIVVAFIPVIGEALSVSLGLIYTAVQGDADPFDWIIAGAGAIGEIGSLFKAGKSFDEIATLTRSIKNSDSSISLIRFSKDTRITKIDDIRSVIKNVCKI